MNHPLTQTGAGTDWISQLNPAQLAQARTLQLAGLVGQAYDGVGFAWRLGGDVVCCAEDHLTLSDAFDEALRTLPVELLEPPLNPAQANEHGENEHRENKHKEQP